MRAPQSRKTLHRDWELWNPPTRRQRRTLIRELEERHRMEGELAQGLNDEWRFADRLHWYPVAS
jgi:hypothetical protein